MQCVQTWDCDPAFLKFKDLLRTILEKFGRLLEAKDLNRGKYFENPFIDKFKETSLARVVFEDDASINQVLTAFQLGSFQLNRKEYGIPEGFNIASIERPHNK